MTSPQERPPASDPQVTTPRAVDDNPYGPQTTSGHPMRMNNDRIEIFMNVIKYDREDIEIRSTDGFIVIEGHHKEKREKDGWIERQFCRRCPLPEGYGARNVTAYTFKDGTMVVTASLVRCESEPQVKRTKFEPTANNYTADANDLIANFDYNEKAVDLTRDKTRERIVDVKVTDANVRAERCGPLGTEQAVGHENGSGLLRDFYEH